MGRNYAAFARRVRANAFRTSQAARHTGTIRPSGECRPHVESDKTIAYPSTWAIQLQSDKGNLVGCKQMFRPLSAGEIAKMQTAIHAECAAAQKVGGSNPKSIDPPNLMPIPIMRILLQDGHDGEMLAITMGVGSMKAKCAPSCVTYGIASLESRKVFKTRQTVVRRGMTFEIPDLPIGDLIPGSTRDEKDRESHSLSSLKIELTEKCGKAIADEVCQLLTDAYESI